MGPILYCNRWNRIKTKPAGSISEEEARSRYSRSEPFCVVALRADGTPLGFVEVGGGSFGAGFLDEQFRQYLDYVFENVDGWLFLSQAINMMYSGQSSTPDETIHFFFKSDGTTTVNRIVGNAATKQQQEQAEVSKNWEKIPWFEEIPKLLRAER